jgi:hypothetical protein
MNTKIFLRNVLLINPPRVLNPWRVCCSFKIPKDKKKPKEGLIIPDRKEHPPVFYGRCGRMAGIGMKECRKM